eukprot:evm.model.NODE_17275_length_21369_cov_25.336750.10
MKITFTTFVAGCSLLLLSLTITPVTVRADQDMEAMDFEVSSGDDMMDDAEATNEVFLLLSEKVAALTSAEATILSLEEQLKASSQELGDKAERLSAFESEIFKLSEQVKELSSELLKGETAAAGAAKEEEVSALTSKLEQAQGEVRELGEKVKALEAALAESEWQTEKAEDEKQILQKDLAEMTEGKRAAETSLDGAKDVAGLAFDRVKYLEGQVAKAKSDAVTARKTWEEELKVKDKEVVETKAKLRDAIENKYSFRVLSEDFSAWSKKAGAEMKIW